MIYEDEDLKNNNGLENEDNIKNKDLKNRVYLRKNPPRSKTRRKLRWKACSNKCLFQVQFSKFEGKAILVVNVASQCGFTDGHYKGLKRLHDILAFNDKLAILGKRRYVK